MDERSQEVPENEQTGLDSLFGKLYQPGPLIAFFLLAFLGLSALGYFILTDETPPPPTIAAAPPKPAEPVRVYEEATSDMEDKVKQADLAIIESMRSLDLNMKKLDLLDVEIRKLEGKGYHYQVLQLPPMADQNIFHKRLLTALADRVPEADIKVVGTNELGIEIATLPTHRLLLKTIELALPRPERKGPKLAVVIDDIGENMRVLNGLVDLDFPVTLAVWPNATHTRASVELISKKRRELIIHFPMEPKGYPRYNPGDDALFVSMSADDIKRQIADNVAKVPEAIGVNNHMGSRFTGHLPGMQVALAEFKRRGLFFLDSLTTGKSVARPAAQAAHIPFYERDVFIDNVKDVNAIVHQLKKAEKVTLKQGYGIAIGHPYPETLAALRQWGKGVNGSIDLVPLSSLTPE